MSERPNLLLITTDQQRGDCLGCDGHPVLETPYLDEMAEQGAHFPHAYTSVPSCTPARAGILTGMDQWNHGRLTMTGGDRWNIRRHCRGNLQRWDITRRPWARCTMLHSAGCMVFTTWCWMKVDGGRKILSAIITCFLISTKKVLTGIGITVSIGIHGWRGPAICPSICIRRIGRRARGLNFCSSAIRPNRFLCGFHLRVPIRLMMRPRRIGICISTMTIFPKAAVGDWAAEFDKKIADVNAPRSHRSDAETHKGRAGYYGNITFIDHQIGRVLYELRHQDPQAYRNTLIIFTSDHGDMMGDHHHWRKTYAYEGSARIPFIVKYPDTWRDVTRGVKCDHPVELRDVMPTLLDAAGVDIPASVDGRSLLDIARGDDEGWRAFVQGEHTSCYTRDHGMQYVTDGHEKYIWFHHTGEEQFFNLDDDPLECCELSRDPAYEPRIAMWRRRLAEVNENRGDPRGQNGELVPQFDGALSLSPNYQKWKEAAQ